MTIGRRHDPAALVAARVEDDLERLVHRLLCELPSPRLEAIARAMGLAPIDLAALPPLIAATAFRDAVLASRTEGWSW